MTKRGFSIIELLVVIAILSLLAVMVIPAVGNLQSAGALTRGGQAVADQIVLARQEAMTRTRNVEVRFVEYDRGGTVAPQAIQLWMSDSTGANPQPLGPLVRLPEGVLISTNPALSPLLGADAVVQGTTNFGALGSRKYLGFRIRATGSPAVLLNQENNFLTAHAAVATGVPPANFYAVRVSPVTGRVSIQRP